MYFYPPPWIPIPSPTLLLLLLIFVLDLLSFSQHIHVYLNLVNTYNLLSDPTLFVKITAVILIFSALAFSLVNETLFKIPPGRLVPVMYLLQGTFLFLYGVVMYQSQWSPLVRLGIAVIFTTPLGVIEHFDKTYFKRHLFIELAQDYRVKLGVVNSSRSVIDNLVSAGQIVIIGLVYSWYSLEVSSLVLCTFGFVMSALIAAFTSLVFKGYPGIPPRPKPSKSLAHNIKTQFASLRQSKIFKVILVEIIDTTTIAHVYISLFLLSSGLNELTMSYIMGITNVVFLLSAVVNVVKYRWRWGARFADLFVLGHAISLVVSVYLSACWFGVTFWGSQEEGFSVGYPTEGVTAGVLGFQELTSAPAGGKLDATTGIIQTVEHPTERPAISMPLWMTVYFALTLSSSFVTGTIKLIKEEFEQDNIPAEDRGSISGTCKFSALSIHIVLCLMNLCLSETLLYLVNFVLSVIVHAVSLCLMVSFKLDDVRVHSYWDGEEEGEGLLGYKNGDLPVKT